VLSRHNQNLAEVIDQKTAGLFVVWFFFCIFLTVSGTPIANIAHGVGAVAGAVLGWTVSAPSRRFAGSAAITVLLAATVVGSTLARPWINLSTYRGYDEAKLGYDDLMANRNAEALQWYRDAVRMQPKMASYWFNMGIACERLNQHSSAMAAYKHAYDLEPSNTNYRDAAQISPG
jgi:cytochrome c-type biogenesis protein CcmH/NrfG